MKGYGLLKQTIPLCIFKGYLPQILLGPFLNTQEMSQMSQECSSEVSSEPSQTSKMERFTKIGKKLQSRYLTGFWIRLYPFTSIIRCVEIKEIIVAKLVIVVSALFFKKDFIIFLIFILRSLFIQIVLSAQDISNLNMRTENGRKVSKTNLIYNPLTNSVTYKSYVDAIAPNEIYYWELPLRYCGDKVFFAFAWVLSNILLMAVAR